MCIPHPLLKSQPSVQIVKYFFPQIHNLKVGLKIPKLEDWTLGSCRVALSHSLRRPGPHTRPAPAEAPPGRLRSANCGEESLPAVRSPTSSERSRAGTGIRVGPFLGSVCSPRARDPPPQIYPPSLLWWREIVANDPSSVQPRSASPTSSLLQLAFGDSTAAWEQALDAERSTRVVICTSRV